MHHFDELSQHFWVRYYAISTTYMGKMRLREIKQLISGRTKTQTKVSFQIPCSWSLYYVHVPFYQWHFLFLNTVSAISKQHSLKALNRVVLYILRTTYKLKVPSKPTFIKTLSSWLGDIWIWTWHPLLHFILLKLDNQDQHQTKASVMISWHSNIMNNFASGSRSHIIYVHNKNGNRPVSVIWIYSLGCGQVKAH